jgi:PAS domain S-box-containing protein
MWHGVPERSAPRERIGKRTWPRRALVYLVFALTAWLSVEVSFRTPALAASRYALSFSVVAAAALIAGVGPALAALGLALLHAFSEHTPNSLVQQHGPVRILPLLVVSLSVGMLLLLIQRRYATEQALRKTVTTLQEHVEALAQAQQASRAAAWTYDVATGRTRWYEGGEEVFGRPHAEVAARASVVELIAPEDQDRVRDLIRHTHETGEPFAVEFRVVWPNGELHWLESRGTPLPGGVWRGTTIDVTGRKLAQDALIRTEKLAIAGRLAASIAHEINNPLEAVTNLCYLGRMSAKDPEAERYIAMAEEELRRVAQITSQTLRFHRQQSAATDTDLGELVETTVAMYRTKLQECGVRTRVEVRPSAPLRCYAGEIRQVLANLIGNAIDAMPAGGLLRLRVRPCLLYPGRAHGVRITVADTGTGMPATVLRHIYEPFYTTKTEVGTGLGLWVSNTLVEKHEGTLSVRSATGADRHGTIFRMELPYPEAALPAHRLANLPIAAGLPQSLARE